MIIVFTASFDTGEHIDRRIIVEDIDPLFMRTETIEQLLAPRINSIKKEFEADHYNVTYDIYEE